MSVKIVSNYQWRQFCYRSEVPADILENDFDHLNEEETDHFFQYKGMWFHTSDFMVCSPAELPWEGYYNLTAFSSVMVRLSDEDSETYQVGMLTS